MKELRNELGYFNSYVNESINNINSLQMNGKNNYINNLFEQKCNVISKKYINFNNTSVLSTFIGLTFNVISILIVIIIGTFELKNRNLSIGTLFSLSIYVQRLYSPIISIGNIIIKFKSFMPLLDNIYNVISTEDLIKV